MNVWAFQVLWATVRPHMSGHAECDRPVRIKGKDTADMMQASRCVGQLTSWNLQSLPNQLQIPGILARPAHSFPGTPRLLPCCLRAPMPELALKPPSPTAGCMHLHKTSPSMVF